MNFDDLPESSKKRVKKFNPNSHKQGKAETLGQVLTTISSGLFQPTREQRVYKHRFYEVYKQLPRDERDRYPLKEADAQWIGELLGTPSIVKWAEQDERFLPWFKNAKDFNERLEALAELALEKAHEIMSSDDPQAMAVQAGLMKMLLPMAQAQREQTKPKVDIGTLLAGMDIDSLKLLVSNHAGQVGVAFQAQPKQLESGDEQ